MGPLYHIHVLHTPLHIWTDVLSVLQNPIFLFLCDCGITVIAHLADISY